MDEKKKSEKEDKIDSNVSDCSQDSTENIIPEEILNAIPEEDRGKVAHIVKQTMISGVMRGTSPIGEKVTSEHISPVFVKNN